MTSGPASRRVLVALVALLPWLAAPVALAGTVTAPGKLSDDDFYRLVSCAAPPGGACAQEPLRWDTGHVIRLALRRIDPGYVGRKRPRADAAVTRAVGELNAAGADFRLARVPAANAAEIVVFFLDQPGGGPIFGTGIDWIDGTAIDEIATLIAVAPGTPRIHRAAVVVSADLETRAYEGAMLKALTRIMGLTTGIDGTAYQGLSVLADHDDADSLPPSRLGPQDIAALVRHYRAGDGS